MENCQTPNTLTLEANQRRLSQNPPSTARTLLEFQNLLERARNELKLAQKSCPLESCRYTELGEETAQNAVDKLSSSELLDLLSAHPGWLEHAPASLMREEGLTPLKLLRRITVIHILALLEAYT